MLGAVGEASGGGGELCEFGRGLEIGTPEEVEGAPRGGSEVGAVRREGKVLHPAEAEAGTEVMGCEVREVNGAVTLADGEVGAVGCPCGCVSCSARGGRCYFLTLWAVRIYKVGRAICRDSCQ